MLVTHCSHLFHFPHAADHLDAADHASFQGASSALIQEMHLIKKHEGNLQMNQLDSPTVGRLLDESVTCFVFLNPTQIQDHSSLMGV